MEHNNSVFLVGLHRDWTLLYCRAKALELGLKWRHQQQHEHVICAILLRGSHYRLSNCDNDHLLPQ